MKYYQEIILKDHTVCILRSGEESDAEAVSKNMIETHQETDFLCSYPDERDINVEQEASFLQKQNDSKNAIEILAFVNEELAGSAGIQPISDREKMQHRCDLGISLLQKYSHLGIGRALCNACILQARFAGYTQMELEVVSTNTKAIALYESLGFVQYGLNPKGFHTRNNEYQALILMYLDLTK